MAQQPNCALGRNSFRTLSRMTSEMRRVTDIERFIPTDLTVGKGCVAMYASFLLGRWVQAPISDRREADT